MLQQYHGNTCAPPGKWNKYVGLSLQVFIVSFFLRIDIHPDSLAKSSVDQALFGKRNGAEARARASYNGSNRMKSIDWNCRTNLKQAASFSSNVHATKGVGLCDWFASRSNGFP